PYTTVFRSAMRLPWPPGRTSARTSCRATRAMLVRGVVPGAGRDDPPGRSSGSGLGDAGAEPLRGAARRVGAHDRRDGRADRGEHDHLGHRDLAVVVDLLRRLVTRDALPHQRERLGGDEPGAERDDGRDQLLRVHCNLLWPVTPTLGVVRCASVVTTTGERSSAESAVRRRPSNLLRLAPAKGVEHLSPSTRRVAAPLLSEPEEVTSREQ